MNCHNLIIGEENNCLCVKSIFSLALRLLRYQRILYMYRPNTFLIVQMKVPIYRKIKIFFSPWSETSNVLKYTVPVCLRALLKRRKVCTNVITLNLFKDLHSHNHFAVILRRKHFVGNHYFLQK